MLGILRSQPFVKMARNLGPRLLGSKVPGVSGLYLVLRSIYFMYETGSEVFLRKVPPGRWDSPIPSYREILARSQALFARDVDECPGVDLKEQTQLELLNTFSSYYSDSLFSPTPGRATRYYYRNMWFSYGDAITLYSFMRHYEPDKVIEIGSGFSSAVMLDVNDLFLNDKVRFTFIDPRPERLFELITEEDKNRHTILEEDVQDVPLEVFRTLSANDILFVDSSHIVKIGSDVGHILFNVLPELRPGVIIQFHDIYWPFENPEEWVLENGWIWNEAYLLRAFLQFNSAFEIIYFNSFIAERHAGVLEEKMPRLLELSEGGLRTGAFSSVWLRKVA